jgi:hypothetical protein
MTFGSILRYKSATEAIGNAMRAAGVDIMD